MIINSYNDTIVREISAQIARDVIRAAQKAVCYPIYGYILATFHTFLQGVDRSPDLHKLNDIELLAFVKTKMWNP